MLVSLYGCKKRPQYSGRHSSSPVPRILTFFTPLWCRDCFFLSSISLQTMGFYTYLRDPTRKIVKFLYPTWAIVVDKGHNVYVIFKFLEIAEKLVIFGEISPVIKVKKLCFSGRKSVFITQRVIICLRTLSHGLGRIILDVSVRRFSLCAQARSIKIMKKFTEEHFLIAAGK